MKKSLFASGFIGAVASLLGVVAVGCSAETGDPGAQIGSSEQAIGISTTVSGDSYAAYFPASIKISATEGLVVGGYDSAGNALTTIRKVTYTNSNTTLAYAKYTKTVNGNTVEITLNDARGEAQIAAIPGQSNKFLIVGGRSSDGGTRLDTAEIIDLSVSPITVTKMTDTLASARVNFKLTPCGNTLLVSGGDSGSAEGKLEVFTFNATHASSTFDPLKNTNASPQDVTLTAPRAFHDVIPASATKLLFVGGEDSNGPMRKVDVLNLVNSSTCQLNSSSATQTTAATGSGQLPTSNARSRMVIAPVSIAVSGTTYDYMVLGGTDDGSTAVTTSVLYDVGTDAFTATSTPATQAHIRPALVEDGAGNWAAVGGLDSSGNSVTNVNYYTGSSTLGTTPALSVARQGSAPLFLDSTYVAGMGAPFTSNVAGTPVSSWE